MHYHHIKTVAFTFLLCSLFSCTVNDRNDDVDSNSETIINHSEAVQTPAIADTMKGTKPTIYNAPDTMAVPGQAPGTIPAADSAKNGKEKM